MTRVAKGEQCIFPIRGALLLACAAAAWAQSGRIMGAERAHHGRTHREKWPKW